ncbi:NAD(P)H:quinone oxidoreductase, partial [Candidatus Woesearchaeota archaeon]|nr:NAD(P)H:quinone oxidoreductase [Candidatus Woesearchaeota archaeon]
NALVDKVAGFFTSTASIHGGQETTLITSMIPMFHLGMIIVGIPYTETKLFALEGGGTPYGASTVAGGDGSRMPSENELEIAKTLGSRVAAIAKKVRG